MTERRINLDVPDLPDPQINGWLEANRIDPSMVWAAQEVLVKDGHIVFIEYPPLEVGHRQLSSDGSGYMKRAAIVPLISAPENHGL